VKKKIGFICNEHNIITEIHPAFTVLDFLRKNLSLTGTKKAAGKGTAVLVLFWLVSLPVIK